MLIGADEDDIADVLEEPLPDDAGATYMPAIPDGFELSARTPQVDSSLLCWQLLMHMRLSHLTFPHVLLPDPKPLQTSDCCGKWALPEGLSR